MLDEAAIDFGDLINYTLELFQKRPLILEKYRQQFKYILVDEFQDTNKVQLEILKLIAKNNVTIVGDQKQSIYGFRGANFGNLEDFKSHFKNYEEVYLHENYRSSKSVIENVNKLVLDIANKEVANAYCHNNGAIDT
jgi:DNA helicase-2/ATP-dependent DNA helicase PcrA